MINNEIFRELPAHARLWIYGVDVPFSPETETRISTELEQFMKAWQSHGRKVVGEFVILHHRFILIAADIPQADISGCGIDASVHALEEAGKQLGFSLLSGLSVFYRDKEGTIQSVPRATFRKLVRSESVLSDTIVFDTSLVELAQLRAGLFELPAHASWHASVFRIASTAT